MEVFLVRIRHAIGAIKGNHVNHPVESPWLNR